ncbi:MAG: GNAT family N-acetyltransferase [Sphingobacteriaceae bacterium]|nr:GNAT family N-acetyltransferase [Sphingobacteriaceae bacterium]
MLRFKIPTIKDAELISQMAVQTFYESHGTSASEKDIKEYITLRLNIDLFKEELGHPENIFRVAYLNDVPVAFSKIIYDAPNPKINDAPVCKLEKIYVLKEYYDQKIGKPLFDLNIELAKQNKQKGIWLYVWTENKRALRFYEKQGFKIIADTLFQISETHSNPNYWLYLKF